MRSGGPHGPTASPRQAHNLKGEAEMKSIQWIDFRPNGFKSDLNLVRLQHWWRGMEQPGSSSGS